MTFICLSDSPCTPSKPPYEVSLANSSSKPPPVTLEPSETNVSKERSRTQCLTSSPALRTPPTNDTSAPSIGTTLPSGVPIVQLNMDAVSDSVASRLAMGLLGHVLFLKNQIPLPVPQLTKMSVSHQPSNNRPSRGAKARTELLASYDTLSSHLATTFAALSVALHHSRRHSTSQAPCQTSPILNGPQTTEDHLRTTDRAYLAVVCGPSLGTAKSRTFLAVDKFEAREGDVTEGNDENRGARDAAAARDARGAADDQEGEDENEERSGDESDSDEEEEEEKDRSAEEPEDSDVESEEDDDDELTNVEDARPKEPTKPPPRPTRLFQIAHDPPQTPSKSSASPHTPKTTLTMTPQHLPLQPLRTHLKLKPRASSEPPLPPPSFSASWSKSIETSTYAEEQRFLTNTERLLSRTLATADAEGYGFASEMAPTQTHILIRAPRCFIHPAWIPRQNLTKSLDTALSDFLTRSRTVAPQTDTASQETNAKARANAMGSKKAKLQQQMAEGVWVTARGAFDVPPGLTLPQAKEGEREEGEDGDEMIWWSWDGRFVGFSEW